MRWALIQDGIVENVIEAGSDYAAPEGYLAVVTDVAGPGWRYESREFIGPDQPEPEPVALRSVAMWRARTIMKTTPWEGGTLFDAVQTAIGEINDPLQRAAAEEALERGTDFDRDGVFVPMLAQAVGISDEQLDGLMQQAAALPA